MTQVDYAVIGEGEVVICELIDALLNDKPVSEVKGIVWKNENGEYIYNGPHDYIENLDEIPFPSYDGMDLDKYLEEQTPFDFYDRFIHDEPRELVIFLGRSCPFSCNFCYHPLGNKYRQRSLDNFFAELDEHLGKYKINSLGIHDELFSLKRETIVEFCRRIKPYNLKWFVQLRVNLVDKELLMLMKDAGCIAISYGIESFSNKILKNMNKKITPEQIEKALAITYDVGIDIQGNFIFGDEEETMETVSETLTWWRANRKYQLNLWFIETYPGTQLYLNSVKRGLIKDRRRFIESGAPIINMSKLTDEEFVKVFRLIELEEFADSGYTGEVLSLKVDEENEEFVSLELKCAHCGEHSTYKRVEKVRSFSNHFKIPCRKCGQRSVYDTRAAWGVRDSEYKYKMYFMLLQQFNMNDDSYLQKYFKDYKEISVLYDDEFGVDIIKEIQEKDMLPLKYVVDEQIKSRFTPNLSVENRCGLDEYLNFCKENLSQKRVIIVMSVYDFYVKEKLLRDSGYLGDIVSIKDVIMDIRSI